MRAKVRGTELFFDVDGMQWQPTDNGLVERPVLFMLHGGPGGDHSGMKSMSVLRDVCQIVWVDHRGSGRSAAANPATYTLDQNIDDVDALREHLGLERIAVLGSSYGGMVAQGYAIRYPERVSNLVLSVTAPSYRFLDDARKIVAERGTPAQQRVCQWLWDASFRSLDQLREYYREMWPMYSTTATPEGFEKSWKSGIRNIEQINLGFGGFLKTFDFTEQLPTIKCPTLVLAGAHDWICPPRHSRIIAERIPRAHLKIFPNSSHAVSSDEPEAFFNAVRGFLTHAPV
ncbi:MAG: alpha/beta fold hydrolase [Pirellulales bacterium]